VETEIPDCEISLTAGEIAFPSAGLGLFRSEPALHGREVRFPIAQRRLLDAAS
jgi:hypothetical protein